MHNTIKETNYSLPGQVNLYRGKVRDVYNIADKYLVMVASDRISAFDHILPKPIPYKGQVLNGIACHYMELTKHLVPNWIIESPDPNVAIGKLCEPIKLEMVIRGYLTGHAWRQYSEGKRMLCGVPMPDGMNESDPFPEPIITPATKADEGHDVDISKEEILKLGIVSEETWNILENYTRTLFAFGQKTALERGLILVDTKYEFGFYEGEVILMDEIHTPDSSRYFYADTYEENQKNKVPQKQLSKEFVRQWLIEQGFMGLEGQKMPDMPDEFVETVSERYISLYEKITGKKFIKTDSELRDSQIELRIKAALAKLGVK
ncbi:MAG: phosphoribosylaminoimidazolesuccinocarboxamide synthase [Flavobacteriales bacterium]|nr:phosphoribosylaminoimidazolesuccinocarboxamide synthase [Flavobacteriales bacterium]